MSHRFRILAIPLLAMALVLLGWQGANAAREGAGGHTPMPTLRPPAQAGSWQTIPLAGATCGRGAAYNYFLNLSPVPNQPLLIYFEGGGACIKEGQAPSGTANSNVYCMNYPNFGAPGTPHALFGLFRRDLTDNAFRQANFAYVPYCTGDLHAGTATTPHDYDPSPAGEFPVTHRGHLNVLAALDDLATRFAAPTPVVLTGSSAGGIGALLNFPAVVSRWPATRLVTDAGTLPDQPRSLLRRELVAGMARWQPLPLPPTCPEPECLVETTRLMAAHADHYDGVSAPWHPFGLIQGQRDGVLASYMDISVCEYSLSLYRELGSPAARPLPDNLRHFAPATDAHTFLALPPDFITAGSYRHAIAGTTVMGWMAPLTAASEATTLPASRADAWPLFPDLDGSGSVTVSDIGGVAEQWERPNPGCPLDNDSDGDVDIADIVWVARHIGE